MERSPKMIHVNGREHPDQEASSIAREENKMATIREINEWLTLRFRALWGGPKLQD